MAIIINYIINLGFIVIIYFSGDGQNEQVRRRRVRFYRRRSAKMSARRMSVRRPSYRRHGVGDGRAHGRHKQRGN